MKPVKGWENVKAAAERAQLPKGAYVVEIKDARVASYSSKDGGTFEKLEISLEILEGGFKGYYEKEYRSQQQEDKRWKGVLRQYIPKDDGSEKDEWTKSSFKALIEAVEDSNPGYHWDWDERTLKGKKAGCLFRAEEWAFDGRTGWTTRPFKLISTEAARTGRFKSPADKPLKNKPANVNIDYEELPDESGLPF